MESQEMDATEWLNHQSFNLSHVIKPVHPKGDQSWVFIERTDVEAETPILWPPDVKSWLIWKDPDAGEDWRQDEKGMTEDEMVEWHYQLDGCGFGWTPGVGDGQGGLVCCGSWGCKESDTTERLNWTDQSQTMKLKLYLKIFQHAEVEDQTASEGNSIKYLENNYYLSISNSSKKIEEEETLPSSFYRAIITVTTKPDK